MSDNLKAWAHWVLAEHPPAEASRKEMAIDITNMLKRNAKLEAVAEAAAAACLAYYGDSEPQEIADMRHLKSVLVALASASPSEGG